MAGRLVISSARFWKDGDSIYLLMTRYIRKCERKMPLEGQTML